MNIKRAILALGAIVVLALSSIPAFAQTTTCSELQSGSSWPNGAFSKGCGINGSPPSDAGQMLSTLQEIGTGTWGFTDAAARLKGFTVTQGDVIKIRIKNDNILDEDGNNKITVKYKVKAGDHLSDIARGLANDVNNDPDLQAAGFSASASGSQISITGPATGDTKYTGILSAGATETISITPDGLVSLAGSTEHAFVRFYMFGTKVDYDVSNEPLNPDGMHEQVPNDAYGVTPFGFETQPFGWSVVFEAAGGKFHHNTPNVTAHELGHHLDYVYGAAVMPNKASHIHLAVQTGGMVHAGDSVLLRINNDKLSNGFEIVAAAADAENEEISSLLSKLAAQINTSTPLKNKGFSATTDSKSLIVYAENNKPTNYQVSFSPGAQLEQSVNSDVFATSSEKWRSALAADWAITNSEPVCGYYASSVPGDYHPGLMSNRKDPNGVYICSDLTDPNVTSVPPPGGGTDPAGRFAGMNNQQIMETAWPEIFKPNQADASQEIFAEQVAVFFNFTDWKYKSGAQSGQENPVYHDRNFQYVDHVYAQEQFPCTRTLVFYLIMNGQATIPDGHGASVGKYPNKTFMSCPAF